MLRHKIENEPKKFPEASISDSEWSGIMKNEENEEQDEPGYFTMNKKDLDAALDPGNNFLEPEDQNESNSFSDDSDNQQRRDDHRAMTQTQEAAFNAAVTANKVVKIKNKKSDIYKLLLAQKHGKDEQLKE